MAYGGADKYYNPDNKVVSDGDVARADDLNAINYAADSAFEQVATDLDSLVAEVDASTELARRWAEEAEDVVVADGGFSAFHWAQKAADTVASLDAASLLNLIKTVDGPGSGLDADTLDGTQLSAIALLASPAFTGNPTAPTQTTDNNSTRLATTAFVRALTNTQVTKDITGHGAVYTLTAAESFGGILGFTGTLNQNVIIDIPAGNNRFVVITNATTGAFTLSLRIVGQAPTYELRQGYRYGIQLFGNSIAYSPTALPSLYVGAGTADTPTVGDNTTRVATTAFVRGQLATSAPPMNGVAAAGVSTYSARQDHVHPTDTSRAPVDSPTFTGTVGGVTKSMVGLGNVDNTSDLNKPVSTATQTALLGISLDLDAHEARTDNPHTVTKSQVGLGNVDNTSDALKPISAATQTALDLKAPLDSPSLTGTPVAPTPTVSTNTTQIATTAFAQNLVSGVVTKTGLTGGTLTLAATDVNTNQTLRLQGALTSDLLVTFPGGATTQRQWFVSNECTGNFVVTLKHLNSVDGQIVIPNGSTLSVSSDGTRIFHHLDFLSKLGENKIINGDFSIWQRATSQLSAGYGSADRWYCGRLGSTMNFGRLSFTFGQTDVPENPLYYASAAITSVAGAGNYAYLSQRIEGVDTLVGKTATISFWAKADAAKNIAVSLVQNFGTGGLPTPEYPISIDTVALTTSWALYTIPVVIPSIAGNTKGSNNNDYLELKLWFDAGSDFNIDTNTLGQQSGTFDFALVQVAEGPYVGFRKRSPGKELELCERYYQRVSYMWSGNATSGNTYYVEAIHRVTMRTTPTSVFSGGGAGGIWSAHSVSGVPAGSRYSMVYATATGGANGTSYSGDLLLSAEL